MEGEREFTEAQVEESGRLMQEVPRIEAALKNYLSNMMAEGFAPSTDASGYAAPSSASSMAAMQGCARVVLKTLNALPLPPGTEWSQRYPQGEAELGMDFVTRIGSYKVVQALWSKCLAGGEKPAKMLGKSSLRFALPEVISQVLADAPASAAAAKATEEQLRTFLAGFEATLEGDAGDFASEASIVWCADLQAALRARSEARTVEAKERVERQRSAEDFAAELKATLSGQAEPNSTGVTIEHISSHQQQSSSVTIEEVVEPSPMDVEN